MHQQSGRRRTSAITISIAQSLPRWFSFCLTAWDLFIILWLHLATMTVLTVDPDSTFISGSLSRQWDCAACTAQTLRCRISFSACCYVSRGNQNRFPSDMLFKLQKGVWETRRHGWCNPGWDDSSKAAQFWWIDREHGWQKFHWRWQAYTRGTFLSLICPIFWFCNS